MLPIGRTPHIINVVHKLKKRQKNDKFGVSWQIVLAMLPKLMGNSDKVQVVMQAFKKMDKFDIETLKNI